MVRYLLDGGFILDIDMGFDIYREGLEKYDELVWGRDAWVERLPDDHPIFTAFFDIRGGMPFGFPPSGSGQGKAGIIPWNYLNGHFVKGRMVGVTPGNGGWGWTNRNNHNSLNRQLQLAVNIVVYALTQEGSITQRLMQMVN